MKSGIIIDLATEYSEDELERQRGILRQQEVQGDDSFEGMCLRVYLCVCVCVYSCECDHESHLGQEGHSFYTQLQLLSVPFH